VPGWGERIRSRLGRAKSRTPAPEMYQLLRSIPLQLDPATIKTPDDEPWRGAAVAMMEIGTATGVASFAAIADGTVSMYTSPGGGVIGAGAHAAVRDAAQRFRIAVAESRGLLEPTEHFPLPEAGQVRFQVRMADRAYTAVATEAALRTQRHPLSELYGAGQDVITEIRLATSQ
jgi:hypothetical protein